MKGFKKIDGNRVLKKVLFWCKNFWNSHVVFLLYVFSTNFWKTPSYGVGDESYPSWHLNEQQVPALERSEERTFWVGSAVDAKECQGPVAGMDKKSLCWDRNWALLLRQSADGVAGHPVVFFRDFCLGGKSWAPERLSGFSSSVRISYSCSGPWFCSVTKMYFQDHLKKFMDSVFPVNGITVHQCVYILNLCVLLAMQAHLPWWEVRAESLRIQGECSCPEGDPGGSESTSRVQCLLSDDDAETRERKARMGSTVTLVTVCYVFLSPQEVSPVNTNGV